MSAYDRLHDKVFPSPEAAIKALKPYFAEVNRRPSNDPIIVDLVGTKSQCDAFEHHWGWKRAGRKLGEEPLFTTPLAIRLEAGSKSKYTL